MEDATLARPEFITSANATNIGTPPILGTHIGAFSGTTLGVITQATFRTNPNWGRWYRDARNRLYLSLDAGEQFLCYNSRDKALVLASDGVGKYELTTWDVQYADMDAKTYYLVPSGANVPQQNTLTIAAGTNVNAGAGNCLQIAAQNTNNSFGIWYMQSWA